MNRGPADDCIRLNVVNTKGGKPVQADNVKQSAQDALAKTQFVADETGVDPDAAGVAQLEAIAGIKLEKIANENGNEGNNQNKDNQGNNRNKN